jgi:hypothetical protein
LLLRYIAFFPHISYSLLFHTFGGRTSVDIISYIAFIYDKRTRNAASLTKYAAPAPPNTATASGSARMNINKERANAVNDDAAKIEEKLLLIFSLSFSAARKPRHRKAQLEQSKQHEQRYCYHDLSPYSVELCSECLRQYREQNQAFY